MKVLLAANWKMNLGIEASKALALALRERCSALTRCDVWLAPSATALAVVSEITSATPLKVGAQNVHWAASGAFTGELSVAMLQEAGCSFAIVGHSERRHQCGESNDMVYRRTISAINSGFRVILCIGETLEEREAGRTFKVLEEYLRPICDQLEQTNSGNLIIAYEPVWAIGTGKVASLEEIAQAHDFIIQHFRRNGPGVQPPILYGGSVTPENFGAIVKLPEVAGALVGGASLKAESFGALIDIAEHSA